MHIYARSHARAHHCTTQEPSTRRTRQICRLIEARTIHMTRAARSNERPRTHGHGRQPCADILLPLSLRNSRSYAPPGLHACRRAQACTFAETKKGCTDVYNRRRRKGVQTCTVAEIKERVRADVCSCRCRKRVNCPAATTQTRDIAVMPYPCATGTCEPI